MINSDKTEKETGETLEKEAPDGDGMLSFIKEIVMPRPTPECCNSINWEQRRYELTKSAMQGILSNWRMNAGLDKIGIASINVADEVIKQLKGEKP